MSQEKSRGNGFGIRGSAGKNKGHQSEQMLQSVQRVRSKERLGAVPGPLGKRSPGTAGARGRSPKAVKEKALQSVVVLDSKMTKGWGTGVRSEKVLSLQKRGVGKGSRSPLQRTRTEDDAIGKPNGLELSFSKDCESPDRVAKRHERKGSADGDALFKPIMKRFHKRVDEIKKKGYL